MESRQELTVDVALEIEERGFAILDGMFSPIEMLKVIGDLEHSSLKRSKAGVRHALKEAAVATLAADLRLFNIAREILGPGAVPFRATLFDKSPQANWLVVWHQDTALPLRKRREVSGWGPWSVKDGIVYAHAPASSLRQVLALRVHLDDSDAHNGPLRVLPGTHTNGVLSDDEIQMRAAQITPVDCLIRKGGVLVMRPLILHASSKSQSEAPRRVVHIEYAASSTLDAGLELAVA
jgi:ectoine hydroxylase-related dioxygenase (phytanoyl-CoA dioxygenase family)